MISVIDDTRRSRQPIFSWHREWIRVVFCGALVLCTSSVWAQREFPASEAAPLARPAAEKASRTSVNPFQKSKSVRPRPKLLDSTVPAETVDRSLDGINPDSTKGKVEQVEFSIEDILNTPLADIAIEGNTTIRTDAIMRHVETRPGRIASQTSIQRDVSQLLNTRWFYSVKPIYRSSDDGPVLVFQVVERPILRSVTFKGNKKIKTAELQAQTGLRPEHAYDVAANRESVFRLKQLYHERGFKFAEVTLEKGNEPDERDVVFNIVEGPKPKIWSIQFNGNDFSSSAVLRTKISSKTVKLWFIQGDYDKEIIQNDVLALKQYYMSLGFFNVDVKSEEILSEDRSKVTVKFNIDEGRRYKVDAIDVIGNEVIGRDVLLKDLKLAQGDYFNERFLKEDVSRMTDLYDEQGRLFAKVIPTPHFREGDEPLVDLVYEIDEDVPRYIGMINVHISGDYPHSKEEVVRQQVNKFLKPGQLARSHDLRMAQARVNGSGFWDKSTPPVFDIVPNDGKDYWPHAEMRAQDSQRAGLIETPTISVSDSPENIFGHSIAPINFEEPVRPARISLPDRTDARAFPVPQKPSKVHKPQAALPAVNRRPAAGNFQDRAAVGPNQGIAPEPVFGNGSGENGAMGTGSEKGKQPATILHQNYIIDPDVVFRGQSTDDDLLYRSQSLDAYGQPVPQSYLPDVSPQGDPFGNALSTPPPGFVDVNIDVTEGRTGRLMFGVGVNSNAGLVGSLVLQEDNFDLFRPPTSFADILNGQAWRGAGQSFRLEAVPGTQVSRYMVSFNDPFFLRSDFSLGVNGFYYNRYYQYWTEERLGGRVNVGYVLNKYWSVSSAVRLENVGLSNLPSTAPPDLRAVAGHSFLSTAGATLQYDARDNSFFPSQGHYANFNYEQGFGEFTYPKFELTGGKYFTTYERPDGFGKQILSFTGQVGFTGDNTPVYERFFAGGYSSFRGFYFRGVSPEQNNIKVGGNFIAVGSAQYMLPITASDKIRTVVFTDFGTVDSNVTMKNFRVSAGFGFRLTLPAMGPAPLAFDFAWPIIKQDTDRLRVFSFYVGFTR